MSGRTLAFSRAAVIDREHVLVDYSTHNRPDSVAGTASAAMRGLAAADRVRVGTGVEGMRAVGCRPEAQHWSARGHGNAPGGVGWMASAGGAYGGGQVHVPGIPSRLWPPPPPSSA